MSTSDLSKKTGLIIITVQKLLQLLISKSDFLKTNPNTISNYILNRNITDILGENFIESLYRPITLISCVDKSENSCEVNDICFFCEKLNKINKKKFLNNISLKNLLNFENLSLIVGDKEILINRIN
jgi:DNA-binding IscR family transcriptional regulator